MKKHFGACLLCLTLAACALATPAFAQTPQAAASLEVEKRLVGDTPPEQQTFTFVLEGQDGAPMPAQDTLAITGAGTGQFQPIVYTQPGDYTYTLREQAGTAERYTYDETVYTVTVQVTTDDAGALTANVSMAADGRSGKAAKAVFVNSYEKEPEPTPPPDEPGTPDTPDTPGTPDTPAQPPVPQTGDGTHNGLWAALLALSGLGMLLFALAGSRREGKSRG